MGPRAPGDAPLDVWERGLYSVGAGVSVIIVTMLALSYLPGPILAWQTFVAFDAIIVALAVGCALRVPDKNGGFQTAATTRKLHLRRGRRSGRACRGLVDRRAGDAAVGGGRAAAARPGLFRVSGRRDAGAAPHRRGDPGLWRCADDAQEGTGRNPAARGPLCAGQSHRRGDGAAPLYADQPGGTAGDLLSGLAAVWSAGRVDRGDGPGAGRLLYRLCPHRPVSEHRLLPGRADGAGAVPADAAAKAAAPLSDAGRDLPGDRAAGAL